MEIGDTQLTISLALTAGGATIFAALIASLIEVLKRTFGIIEARGWEVQLSFLFSAVIVVLAYVDAGVRTLDSAFLAFVAWLGIAKLAGAAYDAGSAVMAKVKG